MESGHTSGQTSRIKGKQRIKECSYVEPACSNIAVQTTVNDETSYMTRCNTLKFEFLEIELKRFKLEFLCTWKHRKIKKNLLI